MEKNSDSIAAVVVEKNELQESFLEEKQKIEDLRRAQMQTAQKFQRIEKFASVFLTFHLGHMDLLTNSVLYV